MTANVSTTSTNEYAEVPERLGQCRECELEIQQQSPFGRLWLPTLCESCEANEKQRLEKEEELERRRRQNGRQQGWIASAGIPDLFLKALDAEVLSSQKEAWGLIENVVSDRPDFATVVLHGDIGTGKSFLAARGVLKFIVDEANRSADADTPSHFYGIPEPLLARYATAKRLPQEIIRDSVVLGKESELQILDRFSTVPLLIIDDLGSESTSSHSVGTLFTIINARYEQGNRTIVTTNFGTPASLALRIAKGGDDLMSSRIVDRLIDGRWVGVEGKSLRGSRGYPASGLFAICPQ